MAIAELLVKILADGSGLEGAFGKVSSTIEAETSKWSGSLKKVGPAVTGVGAAITGIGAVALKLGEPMEQARATLEQAIANAGGNFEELQGKIGNTVNKMADLGFGSADAQTAIEKLTVATGDPIKALNEMALVAEIAAQKHISLAAASALVVKQLAGGAKLAKEFGINVKDQAVATKDVETATKAHAAAVDALSKLQEKQGDAAKIAGAKSGEGAAAAAAATKAVRDAQDSLNTAQKEYATLAAGPAQKDVEAGYVAIANAAKTTRDAQQKVIDAQKALDDLARGATADTQAKAQEAVGKAHLGTQKAALSLSDAQEKLATLQASGTATARQITDAQIAVQEATYGVDDANRTLGDSQAALNKLTSDALPGSEAMKKAQDNLSDAQLSLRSAVDAQADAQKKQSDLFAESVPGSQAMQAALKKVADAQDALTAAQRGGISAGAASVSASISAKDSAEALAAAQAKVNETAGTLKTAQDDLTKSTAKGSVEDQEMAKVKGIAEARSHTFGGQLAALRTHIENVAGSIAGKFAPAMVQAGPLIMGIGAILDSSVIPALIGATGAVWGFTVALLSNPITWVIIGIVALAVAIYEIVKHWSTVKEWILGFWDWLKGFVGKWGTELLAVLVPFIGIPLEIINHWDGIKKFFSGIWDDIKDIFKKGVNWIIDPINSFIGGINKIHIPGTGIGISIPLIPKLQHGGFAMAGRPYLVGEAGPELFVPSASGSVIPHGAGFGGVGPVIGAGATPLTVHSHLWLDGKEIADSVTTYQIQAGRRNVTTSAGVI